MPNNSTILKFRRIAAALPAILVLFIALPSSAQKVAADGSFTPYSMFGVGSLARPGISYNLSMGGIGIGDRNYRYINYLNPAAVTERQAQSFMLDFGIEQGNIYYAANPATAIGGTGSDLLRSVNNTFNMHHIIASFPIWKSSAFKVGIVPYSNVGYKFVTTESNDDIIAEAGDIKYSRIGQGGIYQTFIGAGATFWDRLSVGADLQFYFGTIDRYSNATFTTNTSFRSINSGWTFVTRAISGKLGLQYRQPLAGNTSATIGVTYDLATAFRGENIRYAYGVSTSGKDTVFHHNNPLETISTPSELGVGFTIRNTEKWMVGFDYTRSDWTKHFLEETPGVDVKPTTAQAFRVGFEITPNRYDIRYYLRTLTYRAGAYYEQNYFTLNGSSIARRGITLGVSFPVFRYYNAVTLGIDIGQRGSVTDNLIRERYFLFTLSFDLHDIWFVKTLYQ
jgi:hypothetical protein